MAIRSAAFADDVPYDYDQVKNMSEVELEAYFESGGAAALPAATATSAASGLFALGPLTLVDGSKLDMSTLSGKPVMIMNVASR